MVQILGGLPIKRTKKKKIEYNLFPVFMQHNLCSRCGRIREGKLWIDGKFICHRCELEKGLSAY